MASEYSDHVINMNKLEDRTLQLHIKQIAKEERTSVNILKREIDLLRHECDKTQEKLEQMRKQERQKQYEASIRHIIPEPKENMDLLGVYNTSKYLSSFYSLSMKPTRVAAAAQRHGTARQPSIRTRIVASAQARGNHYSYDNKPSVPIRRMSNRQSLITSEFKPFKPYSATEQNNFDVNSISSCDSESCMSLATIDNIPTQNTQPIRYQQPPINNCQLADRKRLIKSAPVSRFHRKVRDESWVAKYAI